MPLHCPVCVGSNFDRIGHVPFMLTGTMKEHEILGCQTCGHVMVDLQQIDLTMLDELYARPLDEQQWSLDGSSPYEDIVAFAAEALKHVRSEQAKPRIADFGYGRGEVLKALRQHFGVPASQLAGYDFAPLPLGDITTQVLRLDTLDEHSELGSLGQFDLAFCTHVLEHIVDPRCLLRGLRKLARPGAYLYLETPDHSLLNDEVLRLSNQICPQHFHYFTVDRLSAMAASCGWAVVRQEVSLFGFVPRARLLLFRDGDADAIALTRHFLEFRENLNVKLSQTLLRHSDEAPVVAWGAGTDLVLALSREPELSDRVRSGRIVAYDRERAGESLAGAKILSSEALPTSTGVVVLTPRPGISRLSMAKFSEKLGIANRVVDPYLS